jgi:hypothetical protein
MEMCYKNNVNFWIRLSFCGNELSLKFNNRRVLIMISITCLSLLRFGIFCNTCLINLINSASFDTNNDKNNVNEARNENVDKLRQVGGASVNQPSDKNIPDVYQT